MNKRQWIAISLAAVAAIFIGVTLLRRCGTGSPGGAPEGGAGAGSTPEPQSVTVFVVERATFTDAIDGLVGTVKGDTIELSYYGPEEPLTHIHVKVGQRVKKGDLLFELDHLRAESRKDTAEVNYDRAKALHKAGASTSMDLKESKSVYDIALRDYQDTFIRAPKDGYVSEISRQVGETVGRDKSEPIGTLVSSQDKLYLETGVIEGQLDRVKTDQPVLVTIDSLGFVDVRGRVAGVSREVTTTGRTGTVLVGLPSQVQAKLRPGLSARCKILTFDGEALLIPRQAYDMTPSRVFVVKENKVFETKVEIGYRAPEHYEVVSGLNPGDHIVRDLIINPVENGATVTVTGEPERFNKAQQ
ncbi:MAG: efflux RND transporter periplasmic adaptor subunit [Elusimicrobia bacterium]|nr:efflux RND transporter periplasmic adaptor subunit [Elusimicrobiota bacterium]